MVLVGPVAELDSLQQLIGDVGIAGGCQQGREPIEAREDTILDRAWLDVTWPPDEAWHAEATLTDGAFGVLEGGHAAVGPGEDLGAVLGGEDDIRVSVIATCVRAL